MIALAMNTSIIVCGKLVLLIYPFVVWGFFVPAGNSNVLFDCMDPHNRGKRKSIFSLQIGKVEVFSVGIDFECGIEIRCNLHSLFANFDVAIFFFVKEGKNIYLFGVGRNGKLSVNSIRGMFPMGENLCVFIRTQHCFFFMHTQ